MAKSSPKKRGAQEEVVSTVKRMLPVDVDPAAIKKKEKRIVKALSERKKETELMNAEILPRRKRIKELEGEIETLRMQCENGAEDREVKCEVVKNFKTMEVVVRRKDSGAVVEKRTMTEEDRQEDLEVRAKRGSATKPDEVEGLDPEPDEGDDPEDDEPRGLQ